MSPGLISLLVVLVVLVAGLIGAYGMRWYCDDAFITLRYADNYLAGHGLVYNEGEFVEGYTHFLWLLLLICSARLGFDPLGASLGLGLASYVGVLAVFCLISCKLNRGRAAVFVPFTALALAVNRDFTIWATGGLETMFFTFLLSAAFYTYFFTRLAARLRMTLAGTLLILAVLTRPDAALIFILADTFLLGRAVLRRSGKRDALSDLAAFNVPLIPLLAPYLIWKYLYYGDLLPNTYYAKSAGSAYFTRGFYYLWLYFKPHFTSWLALLAAPIAASSIRAAVKGRRGSGLRDAAGGADERSPGDEGGATGGRGSRAERVAGATGATRAAGRLEDPLMWSASLALLAAAAYLILFVARVGGDFMYARFVVPAVPFLMFAIETSVIKFARGNRAIPIIAFAVIALSVGALENPKRDRLLQKTEHGKPEFISRKGVIDEHYLRTAVDDIDEDRAFGEFLKPYFEGLDSTVLLKGRACIGYYAGFKTCIENFGLTDYYIAHLPVEKRSRPGHEKEAPHDYLVKRGVDFAFDGKTMFFERARPYEFAWFNLPDGRRIRVQMFTYDRKLIEALAKRMGDRLEYTDFVKYLDRYISKQLPKAGNIKLLADYMLFRDFYFLHNDDMVRESLFIQRLGGLRRPGAARPK